MNSSGSPTGYSTLKRARQMKNCGRMPTLCPIEPLTVRNSRTLRPRGMLTHNRRTNTQARKSFLLFSSPSFLPFPLFQPLPVLNFLEDFSFYALNAINHQILHRLIQIRSPHLRRSTPPRKALIPDHYLRIHYFQHWLQRPLSYN